MKEIILAGGCFWGCEKFFAQINGVITTNVGYANGPTHHVTYEDVCKGSGHAEAVCVAYDEEVLSLETILDAYFQIVDPFAVNQQGNDKGIQYRTGIYSEEEQDLEIAREYIAKLQEKHEQKIQVEVALLQNYILAEDYHQNYLEKNPNGYCHIGQKSFDLAKKINPQ